MKIKFFEEENEMWFCCEIPDNTNPKDKVYSFSDKIPPVVVENGKTAVRKYAERKAREHIRKKKEIDRIGEYLGRTDFYPLSVKHGDITLKGIIFSDDGQYLDIHLIKPYRGKSQVRCGMTSAMSGRYVHGNIFGFSESAVENAQTRMIQIYEEKRQEELKKIKINSLAEELNKK